MTVRDEVRPRAAALRRLRRSKNSKPKPLMNPYQSVFYDLANLLMRFLFRLLASIEVIGVENVPPRGRLIVIGNHTSWLDPLLVGSFIPRRIVMMSKKENLKNAFGRFIVLSYGVFSIDRGNVDRSAINRTDEILLAEGALGMFPEGHRSESGALQRAKAGTALVAVRHNAPLLPVSIVGAQRGLFGQLAHFHRPRFRVIIGQPFLLPQGEGEAIKKEALARLTDDLMRPIAANLPPEQQGYYKASGQR